MSQITLKQARLLAGLSRQEVSERTGRSTWTIKNWEDGTTYPSIKDFIILCNLYSVQVADIFIPIQ